MKRSLFFIITLLSITLTAIAQPRVTSNRNNYNFGQITWKQPVTAEYIITNTGDKPLVISNVTTSCACSEAVWPDEAIAPGDKGVVKATFDAQALGRFEKSIGIYSNANPHLVYLRFSGEVVQTITDFSRTHTHAIGDIRIDTTELNFADSRIGDLPKLKFSVVNQSSRPYEPVLMHLPGYITMKKSVNVLQKGEKCDITLTLDTKKLNELGLTQTSVYLSRFTGDKVSAENEIPVSIILLPQVQKLSRTEQSVAPAIDLSHTSIDISSLFDGGESQKGGELMSKVTNVFTKKSIIKKDIILTNTGKNPLYIQKLQVFNPAVGASLKKNIIQPGEYVKLRLTLKKRDLERWVRQPLQVLMITNDPERPKVVIDIKR